MLHCNILALFLRRVMEMRAPLTLSKAMRDESKPYRRRI